MSGLRERLAFTRTVGLACGPDGTLLFLSDRPVPGEECQRMRVWALPPGLRGAPWVVAEAAADVQRLAVAAGGEAVVFAADVRPGGAPAGADDASGGIVFDDLPLRHWDRTLGPAERHLFLAMLPQAEVVDLTPDGGRALDAPTPGWSPAYRHHDISPDARELLTSWSVAVGPGRRRSVLVAIDTGTLQRRVLADEPDADFHSVAMAPKGAVAVCVRMRRGTPTEPPQSTLCLVDLRTGRVEDLLPDDDHWPVHPTWSADGSTVFFVADHGGRASVFAVDVAGRRLRRITEDLSYHALAPDPHGHDFYALRSSPVLPAEIVSVPANGGPTALPRQPTEGTLPLGEVTELWTPLPDGNTVHSWLALPDDATADRPAPLAVWIHGGPFAAWGPWISRWCAPALTARGYAVLMPNPAPSLGYGRDQLRRGWSHFAEQAAADVLAATEDAAGRTDRFRCLMSHAGIWALDQFRGTTDEQDYWECRHVDRRDADAADERESADRTVESVSAPLLISHGERDFRVPVGEALRMFTELRRRGKTVR